MARRFIVKDRHTCTGHDVTDAAEPHPAGRSALQQRVALAGGHAEQELVIVAAAQQARRLAAERRSVADQQMVAARSAFANGEIGAFDLFRVRQLQSEALAAEAQAANGLGRARSALNQAQGIIPD